MTDEPDRISVRDDDLLVEKEVAIDPSGDGTVTLRLVSSARDPLAVRVVDDPPGGDRRDLRPRSENLTVEGEAVRFEGVLDPGEIATERYEVDLPESNAPGGAASEPSVSVDALDDGSRDGALYRSSAAPHASGSAATAADRGPDGGDPAKRPGEGRRRLARAVAGADDADVFRLWLRFSSDASPDEREAVVSELEASLLALETMAGPDETFEATIATSHDPDAVVAAVEDVRFVERASVAPADPGGTPDRSAGADGIGADPAERFERIRERTEPLDLDRLLDDPDYLEFLDSFDDLSGPEDGTSVMELLESPDAESATGDGTADEAATGGTGADGDGAGDEAATGGGATADEAADDARAVDAASSDGRDATDPRGDHDTVAEALLAELEGGAVSSEQRSRLRSALGVGGSERLDARASSRRSAGHDPESLGERDSGEGLLDELATELEAIREDVADVRRTQAAHERDLEAVRERVATLARDDDLRALEESVEALERRHEAVREDVDTTLERWERLSELVD